MARLAGSTESQVGRLPCLTHGHALVILGPEPSAVPSASLRLPVPLHVGCQGLTCCCWGGSLLVLPRSPRRPQPLLAPPGCLEVSITRSAAPCSSGCCCPSAPGLPGTPLPRPAPAPPPGRLPSCPSLLRSRCPAAARGDLLTCPRRGKGEPPDRQAETGAAWPPCAEQAARDGFFLECGASLAWHEAWALPASCRPARRWGVTPFLLSPPSSPRRPPCRGCPPRSWAQGHCSPDTSRAPPPGFPDPRVQEDLLPHLPPSCSPQAPGSLGCHPRRPRADPRASAHLRAWSEPFSWVGPDLRFTHRKPF